MQTFSLYMYMSVDKWMQNYIYSINEKVKMNVFILFKQAFLLVLHDCFNNWVLNYETLLATSWMNSFIIQIMQNNFSL